MNHHTHFMIAKEKKQLKTRREANTHFYTRTREKAFISMNHYTHLIIAKGNKQPKMER